MLKDDQSQLPLAPEEAATLNERINQEYAS